MTPSASLQHGGQHGTASFVCRWHTGCGRLFSSKRRLFKHLEDAHGLDRSRYAWRWSGAGSRERRRAARQHLQAPEWHWSSAGDDASLPTLLPVTSSGLFRPPPASEPRPNAAHRVWAAQKTIQARGRTCGSRFLPEGMYPTAQLSCPLTRVFARRLYFIHVGSVLVVWMWFSLLLLLSGELEASTSSFRGLPTSSVQHVMWLPPYFPHGRGCGAE